MTNQQNILKKTMEVLGDKITASVFHQIILSEKHDVIIEQYDFNKKLLKYDKNEIQINAKLIFLENEKKRLEYELRLEEEQCDQVLRKKYRRIQQQLWENQ